MDVVGDLKPPPHGMGEEFLHHPNDVVEGMVVVVPQKNVIAGLLFPFFLLSTLRADDGLLGRFEKAGRGIEFVGHHYLSADAMVGASIAPSYCGKRWQAGSGSSSRRCPCGRSRPGPLYLIARWKVKGEIDWSSGLKSEGRQPRPLLTPFVPCFLLGYYTPMSTIDAYLNDHRQPFESDLSDLLRIASVSADPAYADEVRRAADWMAGQFKKLGLATEIIETDGCHPMVYAETPAVPGKPIALVYGHYDVQPADPLEEWISPPFEPTLRDGNIVARGATDDKGQMLTHLKSVEAWIETTGSLPLQIKFLIEGEEEVGSKALGQYLQEDGAKKLACDVVVISDTSQFAPGRPAITYGLRGIAYFQLLLTGPKQDLHSGTFGGGVTNPANTLAQMLAALVDGSGRVQIPGFYEEVVPLSEQERSAFNDLSFSEEAFMNQVGVAGVTGEEGYSTLERRWARPTYDINGLTSGYQGEGEKTVLPGRASAKFSFRLVPNQNPERITESLEHFLRERCPAGIEMELTSSTASAGFVISLENPFLAAAARAIETGFGTKPVFIREGGSIPIVVDFHQILKADVLLLGWGLSDDNTHGPNEKFCLADFHRGTRSSAALWKELATMGEG